MSRIALVPIVLPGDPVAPLEASTKQYVDAKLSGTVTEVYVGPEPPTDPNVLLWYDTDAVPPPVPVGP